MAARTRTIQRTPKVGLTLKMQPLQEAPCTPCTPNIQGVRWWNEQTLDFDGVDISEQWDLFRTQYHPYQTLVASVVGELCDCGVVFTHSWEHADESPVVVGDPWIDVIQDGGTLVISRPAPAPLYQLDSGVLTVRATVTCAQGGSFAVGPITHTTIAQYGD
jgi:hypothetical protein